MLLGSNAIVDVAVGLALMFLIVSLMATVLNELVATKLKLRASTLQGALKNILDSDTLRADFYDHGLIAGTHDAVGGHPSYLSGRDFALAVIGSLDVTKPVPALGDIKSAVENMRDCNIRDVLLSQLATAGTDIDQLRNGIATYFDSVMDRVGGTYQRYLKLISLGIGFILVAALNVDSVQVGKELWKDASLRAQMVQSGKELLAAQKSAAVSDAKGLADLESELRPIPIGWSTKQVQWDDPSWWLFKVFGLVFSALAVSLGAPFWFELLSKFMNVRGTGVKPKPTSS
jgi:hypothetical protein